MKEKPLKKLFDFTNECGSASDIDYRFMTPNMNIANIKSPPIICTPKSTHYDTQYMSRTIQNSTKSQLKEKFENTANMLNMKLPPPVVYTQKKK